MSPEANANFDDDYQLPEPPPEEPSFDNFAVPDPHDAGFNSRIVIFPRIHSPVMTRSSAPGTGAGAVNSSRSRPTSTRNCASRRMTATQSKVCWERC